ncbi:MAG TPA: hypothetical protein VG733_01295, partial [Chthoniobacteraceae bacterium]|nr:hypothetical protein [Chthoniobacteraceae bacterium]
MKPFLVCFLGLLLAARAASPDNNVATAKKTDVQLIVDLLDGSRIIGQPEADSLKMKTEYASIEIPLSSLRAIEFGDDHVARATLANGDVLAGNPGLPSLSLKTSFGRVEIPFDQVQKIRAHAISAVPPFVNSLGMKFVPLQGTDILVSIWDTRVQDYRAYAQANPNVDESWKNPDFQQGPDHPVVNVT